MITDKDIFKKTEQPKVHKLPDQLHRTISFELRDLLV